jgi:hypothetical protein
MLPPDFLVSRFGFAGSLTQIARLEQAMTALQNEKK